MKTFICVPSLSSPLLLRNPPNSFAFIPLPAMSLSNLNRSNSKAFRYIMPYSAPVCEGMNYHKTGVPWQMKRSATGVSRIFTVVFILLELPHNAVFCKRFRGFVKCVFWLASWKNKARWSKLLRTVSSKVGSKGKSLLLRIHT